MRHLPVYLLKVRRHCGISSIFVSAANPRTCYVWTPLLLCHAVSHTGTNVIPISSSRSSMFWRRFSEFELMSSYFISMMAYYALCLLYQFLAYLSKNSEKTLITIALQKDCFIVSVQVITVVYRQTLTLTLSLPESLFQGSFTHTMVFLILNSSWLHLKLSTHLCLQIQLQISRNINGDRLCFQLPYNLLVLIPYLSRNQLHRQS